MKLFGQLVLLLVFIIHAFMKCQATFCIDHYNILEKEIREHEGHCSDQVKNRCPCCDAEASSLQERRRNYKILCQQEIICGSPKDDCSKNATCTNTGPGSYNCTCNKGYFGDGKTCKVYPECTSYTWLKDATRNVNYNSSTGLCDNGLTTRWYRFGGEAGIKMPTSCVPERRCGTLVTGWMNGAHPTVSDGKVTRKVCYNWDNNCCWWSNNIEVLNCGYFFIYKLVPARICEMRYCGSDN